MGLDQIPDTQLCQIPNSGSHLQNQGLGPLPDQIYFWIRVCVKRIFQLKKTASEAKIKQQQVSLQIHKVFLRHLTEAPLTEWGWFL